MTPLRGRWALAALASLVVGCTAAGDPPVHRNAGATTSPTPPTTAPAAAASDAGAADAAVALAAIDAGAAADAGPAPAVASYADALRAADWAHWPGLPPALREADLVRDLGLRRAATTRHAGRLSRRDAVIVEAPGVRYWLRDRDRVVLVEVTGALGTATPAALRAQLGAADREGAGRFLQAGATTTEYVYAGRGLALTVAESYDQPPSFPPRLAAVQLFAATELRTFVLELGGNDRAGPSR
ncbi:MAG TPA: hypothetical protein VK607_10040 [Kofleriaceae bacterium]|nr:hypothetical protein [Kofleriaceae bacterium]HMG53545.1 hypothetical protein [Kofleriaceae bacterium]